MTSNIERRREVDSVLPADPGAASDAQAESTALATGWIVRGALTAMSPGRGVPVLRAREFVGRVDAMRRHRRH